MLKTFQRTLAIICFLFSVITLTYVTQNTKVEQRIVESAKIILPLPQRESMEKPKRKALPINAIAPRVWHSYPDKKWRGLQLPIITQPPFGKLGNLLGEYATLYAFKRIYGTTVVLHPGMESLMRNTFPNMSLTPIPGEYTSSEWETVTYLNLINYGPLEAAASGLLGPKLFKIKGWPFEIHLFNAFRDEIRKEFIFSNSIQKQVAEFWKKHLKDGEDRTLIGFHIRRGDYIEFIKRFKANVPGVDYYNRAMNYYRKKYPNALFLVASNGMDHAKQALSHNKDVIFSEGHSREVDMALMSSCNHTIITVGTFGFWCGYLSGGEVVYTDLNGTWDYYYQRWYYEYSQLDFFTPLKP